MREPSIEFVEVPYEGTTLPALFMKALTDGRPAPTVVVLNGMDNAKEMSIFFAGREFARRGINTLALDGPGMGETRRIRDMPSRYDYEVPGAAAFDYLVKRSDVDAKHIVIFGYSFGGYYSSPCRRFREALRGMRRAVRTALGPCGVAGEDYAEKRELPDYGGAVEFSVPLGGRGERRRKKASPSPKNSR